MTTFHNFVPSNALPNHTSRHCNIGPSRCHITYETDNLVIMIFAEKYFACRVFCTCNWCRRLLTAPKNFMVHMQSKLVKDGVDNCLRTRIGVGQGHFQVLFSRLY